MRISDWSSDVCSSDLVRIHGAPNEVDPGIPFKADTEPRAYDRDSADRLRRALLSADRVLRLFRSGFLGKVSPVHFFWGRFDLAVTRFSGRPAPLHPGGVPNRSDKPRVGKEGVRKVRSQWLPVN